MKTWEVVVQLRRRVQAETPLEAQQAVISAVVADPDAISSVDATQVRGMPLERVSGPGLHVRRSS